MATRLITFTPQLVAVLPQRKFIQMARIGKPDPVACLRSVWGLMGLSWERWGLLVQVRCAAAGVPTWQGKDAQQRRTLLVTWHKAPAVLELIWEDLQTNAKPSAANDAAKLIGAWPDRRRLEASRQSVTLEKQPVHTSAPNAGFEAPRAPQTAKPKAVHVLAPKPGRIKILRAVHKPEVLKLLHDGLNTVEIAKRMGISRPAVSQIINDTYPYKHD